MTRFFLVLLLIVLAGRAVWRLIDGIVEGASSMVRESPPVLGTSMVRDPVCGTWVVPARALRIGDGTAARYFCSERCLSQFRITL